jgi:NAD-dependent SIR2 family protein deacetylase
MKSPAEFGAGDMGRTRSSSFCSRFGKLEKRCVVDQTVIIVGAGFSAVAGIPTTSKLLDNFHDSPPTDTTPGALQLAISTQLKGFWTATFGWNASSKPPTFEDHFTAIDLAANTGHQLGAFYTPSRLRAIRRLSLHRVFETLDQRFTSNYHISQLVTLLVQGSGNAVVSTNWDIVVERHLPTDGQSYNYGIPIRLLNGNICGDSGLKILKLHGSANWCYCDDCRRLFQNSLVEGKGAYKRWLFLEKRDFHALGVDQPESLADWNTDRDPPQCPQCKIRLSARVATFSFDKALGYYQFQGVWEEALRVLRRAERWIFIGYSLPEADFELRHLLKTAQLAGKPGRRLQIDVILDNKPAPRDRFNRFFGSKLTKVHNQGFETWAASSVGFIA